LQADKAPRLRRDRRRHHHPGANDALSQAASLGKLYKKLLFL
jgi:hypothetical protein